jgi:serine phosphatase RsbU (regulator of sigma subunit)
MLAGLVNVRDGSLTVARAGLPAPVFLPAVGEPEAWSAPGPFLGTAETLFAPVRGILLPGDRLIVGSDGTRPDGDPTTTVRPDHLFAAAVRHRGLTGQAFVDAVARDLLPQVLHADDFTLLVVEMTGPAGES